MNAITPQQGAGVIDGERNYSAPRVPASAIHEMCALGAVIPADVVPEWRPVYERALAEDIAYKILPPGSPAPSFAFRHVGALEVRAPSWGIRNLFETDSLVEAYGPPGSGKSFIVLDIGACIATGAPFHGRSIENQGLVVYLCGEGHAGLARRLKAWSLDRGIELAGFPFVVSAGAGSLCSPDTLAEIEKGIAGAVLEYGAPRLIIVDTWSRNLGGDENSSLDSAAGVAAVDRLRRPYGASAVVVHHSGWDTSRGRGSTVLKAAADLELQIVRGKDGTIRVTPTKVKDSGPPGPLAFILRDIPLGIVDDLGRPVHSAALDEIEYTDEDAPRPPSGKNQTKALEILEEETARHRANVKASGRDPSIARVSEQAWRDACYAAGIPKNRVSEVKKALIESGSIIVDGSFVSPVQFRSGSGGITYHPERNGTNLTPPPGTNRNEPEQKAERNRNGGME